MTSKKHKIHTTFADTTWIGRFGSTAIDRIQDSEGRELYDTGTVRGSFYSCLSSDEKGSTNSYRPHEEKAMLQSILDVVRTENNVDIIQATDQYNMVSVWTESSPLKHLCNSKAVGGTTPSH